MYVETGVFYNYKKDALELRSCFFSFDATGLVFDELIFLSYL